MKYNAVIFDLFETLITEWGHPKYTKSEMCADLGIERPVFSKFWGEKSDDRNLGYTTFEESLYYVFEQCGKHPDPQTVGTVIDKRTRTKAACFDYVLPEVYGLLDSIRGMGLKTAIVSNCSPEEVTALKESKIYPYFDTVLLSCEVHMKKPDPRIYAEAAKILKSSPEECLFVGDGGSRELEGAANAGMKPVQAKWYTNRFPEKRETIAGFEAAEEPSEILRYLK